MTTTTADRIAAATTALPNSNENISLQELVDAGIPRSTAILLTASDLKQIGRLAKNHYVRQWNKNRKGDDDLSAKAEVLTNSIAVQNVSTMNNNIQGENIMATSFEDTIAAAKAAMAPVQNVANSKDQQIAVLMDMVSKLTERDNSRSAGTVANQATGNLPTIAAPKLTRVFPFAAHGKVMAKVSMTLKPEGTYTGSSSYFYTSNQMRNLWNDYQANPAMFVENLRLAAIESAPYVVVKE